MSKETIEIPLIKATYEELQQVICELQVERYIKDKEIERLHSIIKEIREIFKYYGDRGDIIGYSNYFISGEALIKLLEILDKENKK